MEKDACSQSYNHGIHCDAIHCKYNNDCNECTAKDIQVGNHDANNSCETECQTFSPKPGCGCN